MVLGVDGLSQAALTRGRPALEAAGGGGGGWAGTLEAPLRGHLSLHAPVRGLAWASL